MTARISRIAHIFGKMLGAPLVLASLSVVTPAQGAGPSVFLFNGTAYPASEFRLEAHPTPHHHATAFGRAVPLGGVGDRLVDPAPTGLGFGLLSFGMLAPSTSGGQAALAVPLASIPITSDWEVRFTDDFVIPTSAETQAYRVKADVQSEAMNGDVYQITMIPPSLNSPQPVVTDVLSNEELTDIVPPGTISSNEILIQDESLIFALSTTPVSDTVIRGNEYDILGTALTPPPVRAHDQDAMDAPGSDPNSITSVADDLQSMVSLIGG